MSKSHPLSCEICVYSRCRSFWRICQTGLPTCSSSDLSIAHNAASPSDARCGTPGLGCRCGTPSTALISWVACAALSLGQRNAEATRLPCAPACAPGGTHRLAECAPQCTAQHEAQARHSKPPSSSKLESSKPRPKHTLPTDPCTRARIFHKCAWYTCVEHTHTHTHTRQT